MPAIDYCEAIPREHRDFCRTLGVNVYAAEKEASTYRRADVVKWIRGLTTRNGKDRAKNIGGCGRLHAARVVVNGKMLYGLAPKFCKDRACPACGERVSRRMAMKARLFKERRESCGAALGGYLFATFTQPKIHKTREGCEDAIGRHIKAWQKMTHRSRPNARVWKRFVSGGFRRIEITYSNPGDSTPLGCASFPGWHAHSHSILELNPVSDGGKGGEDWLFFALDMLRRAWLRSAPGAREGAQCLREADSWSVGQCTKYCMKPIEANESMGPMLCREAFRAMADRHLIRGFGTWSKWKGEDCKDGPVIQFSESSVGDLRRCMNEQEDVIWEIPGHGYERVHPIQIVDGIRRDARLLHEQVNHLVQTSAQPVRKVS